MTDQDNLRDRIMGVIHRAECGCADGPDSLHQKMAQAIIDKFGLTLEERSVAPGYDGRPVYYNTEKGRLDQDVMGAYIADLPVEFRVVGRWEER